MITNVFLSVIAFLSLHYLFFLLKILYGLKKINRQSIHPKAISKSIGKVSVIIPFRNEADNILNSLKSIEAQDYPVSNYEVIYVNDSSVDNSLELLRSSVSKSNIKIICVPEEYKENLNKKRAVSYGIEHSVGDVIVTTDADCLHSPKWLSTLLAEMDKDTGFVSGPVEFIREENTFSKLQKIEFAGLVLTGAGLIGSGTPVICNAANIAYRRDAFIQAGGFAHKYSLSSGDDELLMQKISRHTKYKVKFCLHKDALVKTAANKDVTQFYQQRKRWASKGLFYADRFLVLKLILIFMFYLTIPLQIFLVPLSSLFLYSFIASIIVKYIPEYFIIKEGTKTLFDKSILKSFLPAEILHIPYIIIAAASGLFGNYSWKGRQLKR